MTNLALNLPFEPSQTSVEESRGSQEIKIIDLISYQKRKKDELNSQIINEIVKSTSSLRRDLQKMGKA